ncbi:hypothetical protein [Dentiradicibacter hellwigii]|jgi:hypothetical protein|uniref:Uncharacterized protein n=1 Tax=Dentiradicibacter hellwigii TaxID=3149053 RepID=A0ABV4UEN4_9RHOO
MRNIISGIIFFLVIVSTQHSYAKTGLTKNLSDLDCAVIVRKQDFGSAFPFKTAKSQWERGGGEHPEYYWMTEVGYWDGTSFKSTGLAFSFSVPALLSTPRFKTSIENILKEGIGSFHFSSVEINRKYRDQILLGHVHGIYQNNEILIFSKNVKKKNEIFKNKPTYALLTFKAYTKKDSYKCIAKIEYLEDN